MQRLLRCTEDSNSSRIALKKYNAIVNRQQNRMFKEIARQQQELLLDNSTPSYYEEEDKTFPRFENMEDKILSEFEMVASEFFPEGL